MLEPVYIAACISAAAVAGLAAALFTPALAPFCLRLPLLDRPDGQRKQHRTPTVRSGGIVLMAGWALGLPVLWLGAGTERWAFLLRTILPALMAIWIVGLADDLISLRPRQKLAGQVFAALLAFSLGLQIETSWRPASLVLTLLWLVVCTNAFNLIDGLDGLAAGLAGIGAIAAGVSAYALGRPGLFALALLITGGLAGFLRFNRFPARAFLGDAGSLSLGFLLGVCGIVWINAAGQGPAKLAPAVAFSIPLADTALAFVRRFLAMKPIFGADDGHLHYRLVQSGFCVRRAVRTLYAAGICGAAGATVMTLAPPQMAALTGVLAVLALAVFVHSIHLREFDAALEVLHARRFRQSVQEEILWQDLKPKIREESGSLEQFIRAARGLGYDATHQAGGAGAPAELRLAVPLPRNSVVILSKTGLSGAADVRHLARLIEALVPDTHMEPARLSRMRHPVRWRMRTLRRLPFALRCAGALVAVRAALVVLPLSRVRDFASRTRTGKALVDASPSDVAYMVQRTSAILLRRDSCLIEALATQYLLGRSGKSSSLRIGVLRSPERRLKGHAWLEHDGRILIGGYDARSESFTILPSFT